MLKVSQSGLRDENVMDSQTFTTKLSTPTISHEIAMMKLMELSHGPVNHVVPSCPLRGFSHITLSSIEACQLLIVTNLFNVKTISKDVISSSTCLN